MGSTQRISSIADAYGIFTYKDDLIWFTVEDHENWQHRELAMRLDPYIKKYIGITDDDLTSEKPITEPDIFGGQQDQTESGSPDQNEPITLNGSYRLEDYQQERPEAQPNAEADISEDWDNERWDHLFKKIMDKARGHSFCIVSLYNSPPYWRVFYDRQITEITYNDQEIPVKVLCEWSRSLPYGGKFKNFREEITLFHPGMDLMKLKNNTTYGLLIPFGQPETEETLGQFDLEDKWTTAVRIRYADLDIANNSSKTSGFYHYMYGDAINQDAETALKNALDMASSSNGVGAKENILKQILAIFPAKPEFTLDAKAEFIREFANASGFPLSYYRSESEKSNAFSMTGEVGDDQRINKRKLAIFNKFKSYFISLIFMRWGIQLENIEPYLYESEEEQLDIPYDPTQQNNIFNQNQNKNKEVIE